MYFVADKKTHSGAAAVAERMVLAQSPLRECPKCGARARLYRTPRGLRCTDCVKKMDSSGLGF
jgi:hypothetical protein